MAEPDPRHETSDGTHPATPPGMPTWVKVTMIVVGVLLLVFLVLQATGVGGEHGPGRHFSCLHQPIDGDEAVTASLSSRGA